MNLTQSERDQLYEVADVEGEERVMNALGDRPQSVEVEDEGDIGAIRSLSGRALESGAADAYGFDELEDVYEKASRELFPESYE